MYYRGHSRSWHLDEHDMNKHRLFDTSYEVCTLSCNCFFNVTRSIQWVPIIMKTTITAPKIINCWFSLILRVHLWTMIKAKWPVVIIIPFVPFEYNVIFKKRNIVINVCIHIASQIIIALPVYKSVHVYSVVRPKQNINNFSNFF